MKKIIPFLVALTSLLGTLYPFYTSYVEAKVAVAKKEEEKGALVLKLLKDFNCTLVSKK